jgi:hypothetical protein
MRWGAAASFVFAKLGLPGPYSGVRAKREEAASGPLPADPQAIPPLIVFEEVPMASEAH